MFVSIDELESKLKQLMEDVQQGLFERQKR
jgi:hypothetical protein